MDPFTQGMLGVAAAQAGTGHKLGWRAAPIGLLGGVLADADSFLRVFADPALPNELHRHFTHSLIFIPIGGLIAGTVFLAFPKFREQWRWTLLAGLLAYATHAVLDACTAYGTKLLWPFDPAYIAWDTVSIIDPLFTVPLTIGVIAALVFRKKMAVIGAVTLLFCVSYLGFGLLQRNAAADVQRALMVHRGHTDVERSRVMPTLGNQLLWRSVYVHEGRLYADAIRVAPWMADQVEQGQSVEIFTKADLPSDPAVRERVADVFSRFSAFSDGYMARVPGRPDVIADMRYSLDPAGLDALWGLRLKLTDPADPIRAVGLQHRRENLTITAWRNFYHAFIGPPGMVTLDKVVNPPVAGK